jgi:parallel beta-helix repeat protein
MVLILMSTAQATVWYVHPDSMLNSIQTALNACNTNDIVIVGAGTYYEHINWPSTQGIRLVSEYGPDTTIIDGSGTGRVVMFNVQLDTTTIIMGFKITDGYSNMGSGIFCSNYASPKIAGNIIVDNASNDVTPGIHCQNNASPVIIHNVVRNNTTAYNTAGIGTVTSGAAFILQNIVSGNASDYQGAAIGYGDGSQPSVIGNFVLSNLSVIGGGIGARNTSGPIIDNVVFNNHTDSLGGGIGIRNCSSIISDNIIVKNISSLSEAGGIGMDNSSPTIEGCYIAENTGDGIYCENNSTPTIHYCDIIDNAGYALHNISPVTIDAENNWWGHASGPYHSTNPSGQGDTVSDYVDFDPWGTYPSCPVTVWYVHPDSTLNSIQTALNACNANDIVIVGAGTYYEHITWPATQGIRLISEYGPDTTIIDGSGTGRVVTFNGTLDTTTMIMGFKITHGYDSFGGGIYCGNYASPKIAHNVVVGNETTTASGGIHCQDNASPLIVDNTIRNNIAHVTSAGIGVVLSGSPTIAGNIVAGNMSYDESGGIGFGDGAEASVIGNFVVGNSALYVGGIGFRNTTGPVSDNLVFNNSATFFGGGIGLLNAGSLISGNIITDNIAAYGGGVACSLSTAKFDQCMITSNHAGIQGGGIYTNGSNTIVDCTIIDNTSDEDGAGIFCIYSTDTIVGNTIENNVAADDGGGLMISEGSAPVVTGNTFSGDSAGDKGGGVYVSDWGSATIINNTVTDNAAAYCAGGIGLTGVNPPTLVSQNTIELNRASIGGGLLCYYADITINHNLVANNTASYAAGIGCWYSSPTIDSCNILNNVGDGIYCDSASTPMITWNNICGNTPYGVCNEWTSVTVNAENNWWDHSTGPYHSTGNPSGQGDPVGDYVDFDPWLPDSVQGIGIEETHELVVEDQHSRIIMPTILNGSTLPFTLRQRGEMSIKLYDLVGRECWSAERATYESGSHTINLPQLSNGIYFIKFAADEQQETRKLLFIR